MRITLLMVAAILVLPLGSAEAAPNQCDAGARSLQSTLSRELAACSASRADIRGRLQEAQWAPGSCGVPGQATCVNGWVAVCQCFSYGCHYMATSRRC